MGKFPCHHNLSLSHHLRVETSLSPHPCASMRGSIPHKERAYSLDYP